MIISFGDTVKILNSSQTDEAGLSGKTGEVLGETSPSSTGVTYFGDAKDDYVINVAFEEPNAEYWFTPDLLELLNEDSKTDTATKKSQSVSEKNWWQFWKQ
ncbi:MAG: hypothetical protein HND53_14265 [Proteobacteria bacterium]|nr:hypothetical protein [Pseudomonadota bacterium]NOG61655.1 hypothetical protein [Pseudomonadota bacterium]